ncbi:hypothetical protein LSAT2_006056 [Lamellibrachia satsuma]|nr:hypothetical protein LSAT2_006056 [Lamellibrachia satsuma]
MKGKTWPLKGVSDFVTARTDRLSPNSTDPAADGATVPTSNHRAYSCDYSGVDSYFAVRVGVANQLGAREMAEKASKETFCLATTGVVLGLFIIVAWWCNGKGMLSDMRSGGTSNGFLRVITHAFSRFYPIERNSYDVLTTAHAFDWLCPTRHSGADYWAAQSRSRDYYTRIPLTLSNTAAQSRSRDYHTRIPLALSNTAAQSRYHDYHTRIPLALSNTAAQSWSHDYHTRIPLALSNTAAQSRSRDYYTRIQLALSNTAAQSISRDYYTRIQLALSNTVAQS